jgi:hypothetical protein
MDTEFSAIPHLLTTHGVGPICTRYAMNPSYVKTTSNMRIVAIRMLQKGIVKLNRDASPKYVTTTALCVVVVDPVVPVPVVVVVVECGDVVTSYSSRRESPPRTTNTLANAMINNIVMKITKSVMTGRFSHDAIFIV